MSSTNRSPLVTALISSGTAASSKRKDDKLNEAGDIVGELFSDVDAGTRPVADLDGLIDYLSGNAQQPGQPVGALGAGSPGTPGQLTDNAALQHLWNSTTLDQGLQNALIRLFAPVGDANRIEVKDDGTPVIVDSLKNEVRTKESERSALESQLNDERDDNKPGSLAGKLKAATAAPATPAGSVNKATIKAKVNELKNIEEDLETTPLSTKIQGRTDLKAAIDELEQLVS